MSTIVTSNVSDGTLSIPTTFVTNGSAKAWVNFDGTGTISLLKSLNVSSIVDNGTGEYTTNFSSSFADTLYVHLTSARSEETVANAFGANVAGSCRIVVANSAGGAKDSTSTYNTCFGDLA